MSSGEHARSHKAFKINHNRLPTICFSLAAFTDPSGPPSNAGSDIVQHDMKVREGALESDNGPELKYASMPS